MVSTRSISQYLVILSVALVVLIYSCSSDDNDGGNVIVDPEVNTTPAPANLMGIWKGVMTKGILVYDVIMVFHYPDGADEGRVSGVAVNQQTGIPFLLIDSGYMEVDKVAHPDWDFDYLIGREGSQGTELKRFSFENKLVSRQSGTARLSLEGDDTLTGTANFEGTGVDNLGEFYVAIKYWDVNLDNQADVDDLVGTWTDVVDDDPNNDVIEDLGWDDSSKVATLVIAANNSTNGTLQPGSGTDTGCAASDPDVILDVGGHNIFLFGNYASDIPEADRVVTLSSCGTRDWNDNQPVADMNGTYDGIGVLYDDNGTQKLFTVLVSTSQDDPDITIPVRAIFNEFEKE